MPELGGSKAVREWIPELEPRLLVGSRSVHSEGGAHVRALTPWSVFTRERPLTPLPRSEDAKARFEAAVRGWAPEPSALLPWNPGKRARKSKS